MAPVRSPFRWKVVSTPLASVDETDDVCIVKTRERRLEATLVDPMIHGDPGRRIRQTALDVVEAGAADRAGILAALHARLAGTAGASVALLDIDTRDGRLRFQGIGRIRGRLIGPLAATLSCAPGIVGVGRPSIPAATSVAWKSGACALLAIDGIVESWDLGYLASTPSPDRIALHLAGPRGRPPDDATLLVITAPP